MFLWNATAEIRHFFSILKLGTHTQVSQESKSLHTCVARLHLLLLDEVWKDRNNVLPQKCEGIFCFIFFF